MSGDMLKLNSGIFIDYGCTGLTAIQGQGVFIPFNHNGGQAMRDLDEFLVKHHYCEPGEGVPVDILNRDPQDILAAHDLLEQATRDNGGVFPPDYEERFLGPNGLLARKSQ